MKLWQKLLAVAVLVGAVVFVVEVKNKKGDSCCAGGVCTLPPSATSAAAEPAGLVVAARPMPKLVDLGAGKCVPCKMMKPTLEDLKANYADRFETVFIDVWENEGAGEQYGIRVIPTQIFYDTDGKELFRHEGFFSKEDILAKWEELGYGFAEPQNDEQEISNIEGD
ncbi:MAG: thioredoxin family protein [Kiritimatiellales bacterium]|nr:thioredoxin family protein [Kiritimatiellales bacterium]